MNFSIIACVDAKNGLGKNNTIPWHLKADFKHFAEITTTAVDNKINAVIMGKNTWASLPEKYRPLPGRINIVLSPEPITLPAGVLTFTNLEKALDWCEKNHNIDQVFIGGGGYLYSASIIHPACEKIYLTKLEQDFNCQVFFPEIPKNFILIFESPTQTEGDINFKYQVWEKKSRF